MLYGHSESVFKIEKKNRLQNVFISTSSHKIWSRLEFVFKILQWKGLQNVFMTPSNY